MGKSKRKRFWIVLASSLTAFALSAHGASARAPDVATPEQIATQEALLSALRPPIQLAIGGPIALTPTRVHHRNGFAFVVVDVKRPNGHDINLENTPVGRTSGILEQRVGNDLVVRYQAILRQTGRTWQVRELNIMAMAEPYLDTSDCTLLRPVLPSDFYRAKCQILRR
jgi:hypothetical protein